MSDFDLNSLLQQAMSLQQQLAQTAAQDFEGTAGGGMVKISLKGSGELNRVTIDPSVVDPSDVETLEDLIVAAWRDALRAAQAAQSASMPDLGGAGLGGIAGLLGGEG
ncbi:MAG: YbaB/EbfC family nucleoid-associated protein [Acidimicrobiia bacterium]